MSYSMTAVPCLTAIRCAAVQSLTVPRWLGGCLFRFVRAGARLDNLVKDERALKLRHREVLDGHTCDTYDLHDFHPYRAQVPLWADRGLPLGVRKRKWA